jgi:hypothetical protein
LQKIDLMYFNPLVSLIVVSKVVRFDRHIKRIYNIKIVHVGRVLLKIELKKNVCEGRL